MGEEEELIQGSPASIKAAKTKASANAKAAKAAAATEAKETKLEAATAKKAKKLADKQKKLAKKAAKDARDAAFKYAKDSAKAASQMMAAAKATVAAAKKAAAFKKDGRRSCQVEEGKRCSQEGYLEAHCRRQEEDEGVGEGEEAPDEARKAYREAAGETQEGSYQNSCWYRQDLQIENQEK